MSKEIRAVCYARVSSKEQAEKELSVPAQLEAMRNYCKQKGGNLYTNTLMPVNLQRQMIGQNFKG